MKTPDEIKKGLQEAPHVKYIADDPSSADGRDVRYGIVIGYVLREEIVALIERLAQAERERDALLDDLRHTFDPCCVCKKKDVCEQYCQENDYNCPECKDRHRCICHNCTSSNDLWEWRGVCEENSK